MTDDSYSPPHAQARRIWVNVALGVVEDLSRDNFCTSIPRRSRRPQPGVAERIHHGGTEGTEKDIEEKCLGWVVLPADLELPTSKAEPPSGSPTLFRRTMAEAV